MDGNQFVGMLDVSLGENGFLSSSLNKLYGSVNSVIRDCGASLVGMQELTEMPSNGAERS